MTSRKALIVFKGSLPPLAQQEDFDEIIAPRALEGQVVSKATFVVLEDLVEGGSVHEAATMLRTLSRLTFSDGGRLSHYGTYREYQLWWMHYDDLYLKFCLPYTEYKKLLDYLSSFEYIELHGTPHRFLFEYFLRAHGCAFRIVGSDTSTRPALSNVLQVLLSVPFLLWLSISRPRVMLWTSDRFDPPRDHDFRYRYLYEELHSKHIAFVEFIRSQERWQTILAHAWRRRRPVIYTHALQVVIGYVASFVSAEHNQAYLSKIPADMSAHEKFLWSVATHFVSAQRGDRWSIVAMQGLMRCIGIQVAIIPTALSRNFHEVLACKLQHIPVVGILHGVASKDYNVYDFMPDYDGKESLSVTVYGVWSEWWKEYYLKHSRVYAEAQLVVSGPMRPLVLKHPASAIREGRLKVLFVAEQLAVSYEVMPYLRALLADPRLDVYIKFRSYKDGFEEWLRTHEPRVLASIPVNHILKGDMNDAIERAEVVVGSHSTAVLEALFQEKPPILFNTNKWGDYFELQSFKSAHEFIANTPEECVELVLRSKDIPRDVLQELQRRFFGNPQQNGSAWVVNEVQRYL